MNDARAHGAVHIDAGALTDVLDVGLDDDGRIAVRICAGTLQVWLGGTRDELDEFLTDVRCKIADAFADRDLAAEHPVVTI